MKILYYSPHPMLNTAHQAGYATHINEMIEAFQNLGHEVLPVIMGGTEIGGTQNGVSESKIKKLAKKFIPVVLWETLKDIQLLRFDKFAEKTLAMSVKKFQPDLIYERANYLQLSGINVAKKKKIKHILEINAPYVEERITLQGKSLLLKIASNIEKRQLSQTNLPVVVSTALQNYFSGKYNIPSKHFLVTPNAINLNKISTDTDKIKILKNQYNQNNDIIIGFIGSFFRWHGIDMLIEAFCKLNNNIKNIKLILIGSGEIDQELKVLANKLCSTQKIIFTGSIPHSEIFNYIKLFDIAVMSNSNWYGSPVKIFEYGIMKKAIIAPNLGPLQDIITTKKEALLIVPSVENLKIAIKKLIINTKLREKLEENFYNKIKNNYTWSKNAINVLKKQ